MCLFAKRLEDPSRLRKRPLEADAAASARAAGEIDIAGCATIAYSSENPVHPVEHMLARSHPRPIVRFFAEGGIETIAGAYFPT
jgi:hypothetical protein